MSEDKKPTEKKVTVKAKPVAPNCYNDGKISMHESMITTEEDFVKLWKGTKGVDLKKAFKKAKKWREQFN